jgi:quercetin dioxygenase-like cupin family protein
VQVGDRSVGAIPRREAANRFPAEAQKSSNRSATDQSGFGANPYVGDARCPWRARQGAIMSQTVQSQTVQFATTLPDNRWLVSPDAGPWFDVVPGEVMRIRVRGRDAGGRYTIVESISQPMAGPPRHIHREDEVILVLDGVLTFEVNGTRTEAGPGTVVTIPAGLEHAWRNFGDRPAHYFATFTPGGIDELFTQVHQVAPEALADLAACFGSTITGAPIEP